MAGMVMARESGDLSRVVVLVEKEKGEALAMARVAHLHLRFRCNGVSKSGYSPSCGLSAAKCGCRPSGFASSDVSRV